MHAFDLYKSGFSTLDDLAQTLGQTPLARGLRTEAIQDGFMMNSEIAEKILAPLVEMTGDKILETMMAHLATLPPVTHFPTAIPYIFGLGLDASELAKTTLCFRSAQIAQACGVCVRKLDALAVFREPMMMDDCPL